MLGTTAVWLVFYLCPLLLLMSYVCVSLSGDETYQDIFQDFTHMAANDPDKLNRYQQYDQPRPWHNSNTVH